MTQSPGTPLHCVIWFLPTSEHDTKLMIGLALCAVLLTAKLRLFHPLHDLPRWQASCCWHALLSLAAVSHCAVLTPAQVTNKEGALFQLPQLLSSMRLVPQQDISRHLVVVTYSAPAQVRMRRRCTHDNLLVPQCSSNSSSSYRH